MQLVDLVALILDMVPPWVRIYRIQRDIPMPLVSSGVEKGNLRELALARSAELGLKCRDVRTREVGIQDIHHKVHDCVVSLVFQGETLVIEDYSRRSGPRRLSLCGEIMSQTGAGRRSYHTRTQSKTS